MSGPIGIMGALPEEVADLVAAVEQPAVTERGGRRFVRGRLFGHDAILVHSRCGKVAAAATAVDLIASFDVSEIIFTGVAGHVREDLHVGDVVVATELLQHDMDAAPLFPRYEIPMTGRSRHPADRRRRDQLLAAAETFVTHDAGDAASPAARAATGLDHRTPQVVAGVIASGDRFFASDDAIAALRADLPDVVCVEMEGAAVAQVAHEYGIPVSVLRTISDGGDDAAAATFWSSLTAIAAAWSHGILERMLRSDATPG